MTTFFINLCSLFVTIVYGTSLSFSPSTKQITRSTKYANTFSLYIAFIIVSLKMQIQKRPKDDVG